LAGGTTGVRTVSGTQVHRWNQSGAQHR